MSISLSPAVTVREVDLTNVVPAVATSIGAAVIEAVWGPVMDITTVDSENVMVQRFGKPSSGNAANWFAAANFLSYSNNMLIVRSDTNDQRNAVSILTGQVTAIAVASGGAGYSTATLTIAPPRETGSIRSIEVATSGAHYNSAPTVNIPAPPAGGTQAVAEAVLDITDPANPIVARIRIINPGAGYTTVPTITFSGGEGAPPSVDFAAATIGDVTMNTGGIRATATITVSSVTVGGITTAGVITGVEMVNPGSGYHQEIDGYYASYPTLVLTPVGTVPTTAASILASGVDITQSGIKINNESHYEQAYSNGEAIVGEFAAKWPGAMGNSIEVQMADSGSWTDWPAEYKAQFDGEPNTSAYASKTGATDDEVHILVIDADGKISGTPGFVLEKFAYASKASDARKEDGSGAYYRNVLNIQSKYVWWMDHPLQGTNWGQPANGTGFALLSDPIIRKFLGGADHLSATQAQRINAFDLFSDAESLDVNLIIAGKANATVASFVVQNIAEVRKDCMVFVSPEDADSGEILVGNTSDIAEKMIAFRNLLPSSSYFVIDSGYKYQYDRYNDAYRWVPLNGDIAGLCARTDATNDPWFSPAGFNRGQIKNIVKLAYSPRKTDRDSLYMKNINPVVAFPGQGVVLFGDKTGLTKPSAFDRINVRRLFIVLEKAIATSAKYQLFDMNDVQSRAQFRSTVEPFLRDVKGRRGIYEFKVVCDETNNTPEVIDTNRFAASIFLQPARSINFIELTFIATRTGVNFDEIAGSV